jgi:hypothetical protein
LKRRRFGSDRNATDLSIEERRDPKDSVPGQGSTGSPDQLQGSGSFERVGRERHTTSL